MVFKFNILFKLHLQKYAKFFNFSKFSITNYYTFLRVQLKTLGLGTSFPIFFCDEIRKFVMKFPQKI